MENIVWQPYVVYILFITFILIIGKHIESQDSIIYNQKLKHQNTTHSSFLISVVFALYFTILKGNVFQNKVYIWTQLSKLENIVIVACCHIAAVYFVLSVISKQRKIIVLSSVILATTLIQGGRTYLVSAILPVLFYRLVYYKNKKNFLFIGIIAVIGFIGKSFAVWLKTRSLEMFLWHSGQSLKLSEPYVTQWILNTIVKDKYQIPISMFLKSIASKILYISNSNMSIYSIREYLNVAYGIDNAAYNIFAEWYVVMGIAGVAVFIFVHILCLLYINKCIRSNNALTCAYGLSLSYYFCFYVFRSSIENMILYAYIHVFIYLLIRFSDMVLEKIKLT